MAININNIDPRRLTLEDYSVSSYIEYFVYNLDGSLLYPKGQDSIIPYTDYQLIDNNLVLDPEKDLIDSGFFQGSYNTYYNFLSNRGGSNPSTRYFISEISSDRTEIRLTSNVIPNPTITSTINDFIAERATDPYYPDFFLNFGENKLVIANNIALDGNTVLIKLYEALPLQFQLKSTCYLVEEVAEPIAYNLQFIPEPTIIDNSIRLKGPNLNLNLKNETSNASQPQSYQTLTGTDLSASLQQINSFYQDKSIAINVDYTNFSNFINFSSAEKRVSNFFYKLEQIENWTSLASSGSNIVSQASSSTAFFEEKINETINEFDTYEYYLYFSSGSTPYPKTNSTLPYTQASTTSTEAQNWITASLSSGSAYDANNLNWIYNNIPEYIKNEPLNQSYIDFNNMVGHFYDENIWIYVKDITNKWDNDNRIDSGISPDLIAQQLRDLGFTIYENNFSSFNLFTSTLGITPSGSTFPYAYMTGSLPTPTGYEYVNNFVTGSNEVLPQDDVNKRLYKRLYNALPYLYKKKGTIDGIRALATIYGIPDTLLQINEFGSKDKDNTNDYDFWFNQFNYKYDTGDGSQITTEWTLNPEWISRDDVPHTVEFRFKTPGLGSAIDYPQQALWVKDDTAIVLDYTGSGFTSGSYSGSIPDPYNEYATLIFTTDNFVNTASVYLPFFDGGWWSVAVSQEDDIESFILRAANNIYSGVDGSQLGFNASSSVITPGGGDWLNSISLSNFSSPINSYVDFSGSYQEIRYYTIPLNSQSFFDYTMNPQSIEGNGINGAPDQLAFRASLGGELYTGSESIHPKVTGSWTAIPSFNSDSDFTITRGLFTENNEYVYMDQPAVGIKNRVSDKIRNFNLNLPSGNQQLSNINSIQQDNNTANGAYTDTVNLVEVALSPTNQINDDIIDSLGYFNIGEYIGDPRLNLTSSNTYPDLVDLSNDYFLKYTGNYDWNDFIRLIKFFDNSLFKLIKDFVPAKISAATGITIKQHLLERNKYTEPQVSRSFHELTGSIGQIPYLLDGQRAYSASDDYQSFPIVIPSGSQGGTLPNFVLDTNYTDFDYPGAINVTQSWTGSNITPFGFESYTQDDAREFIDGEFSGSTLVVTTQSLNPNNPYKSASTITLSYISSGSSNTDPLPGEFYWNPGTVTSGNPPQIQGSGVDEIYINETDNNGLLIESALSNLGPGDTMTFTIRTEFTDPFGPASPPFNQTLTQTIGEISTFSPQVWRIKFINFPAISSPIYDLGLGLNVTSDTVFNPFVNTPAFDYSPFNAIINNALIPRQSEIFWDLDYQSNAIQAVNQQTIITASQQNGNLPKAFVQDYNWYSRGIKNSHYLGARSTANDFNLPAIEGGYGQLPVVQSEGYYFAFFNWVGGTSPEWGNNLEDRSAVNVRYYIDENANVIEPINDSNGVNLGIVQQNFEQDSNAILSFNDKNATTSPFANLEGTHPIFKSGQRPVPIIYSQTSSIGPDTGPDLFTGSLEFVQGDQQESAAGDYRLRVFADTAIIQNTGTVAFSSPVLQGGYASFASDIYAPTTTSPSGSTPATTLTFEAYLEDDIQVLNGSTATFFIQKNSSGGGWVNVSPNIGNILEPGAVNSITITYTDANSSIHDDYRLQITATTSGGQGQFVNINTNSYLRVSQSPPPAIGSVGPDVPAPNNLNYWEKLGAIGTPGAQRFKTKALTSVYGQRQKDIDNSGFYPITLDFVLQVGDQIRFQGTETQTYTITSVDNAVSDPGAIVFTVDRQINLTNPEMNWFLVRRYINDPSYILLSVDKPAGGTSSGILTPEYFYGGTEEKVNSILKTLTTEQLIG